MAEFEFTIGQVRREGIKEIGNPYIPGIRAGSRTLAALDYIFTSRGMVFDTSKAELLKAAKEAGLSEHNVTGEIEEMKESGWVQIEGDTIIPQESLINRYQ